MNPRSLDVVLSLTQGLRMRVEGDSPSSDSGKIAVYANPKSIILPTEKDDWLIIQSVKGKDKKGNEAIFDFYTLFGVTY
jgi:hypothetical protein